MGLGKGLLEEEQRMSALQMLNPGFTLHCNRAVLLLITVEIRSAGVILVECMHEDCHCTKFITPSPPSSVRNVVCGYTVWWCCMRVICWHYTGKPMHQNTAIISTISASERRTGIASVVRRWTNIKEATRKHKTDHPVLVFSPSNIVGAAASIV